MRAEHHRAAPAGSTVFLKRESPAELPAELLPLLDSRDDEGVTLKLADHDQLEGILACMRMAGVRVKELRTVKTDLEDVFVSMMQGQGS